MCPAARSACDTQGQSHPQCTGLAIGSAHRLLACREICGAHDQRRRDARGTLSVANDHCCVPSGGLSSSERGARALLSWRGPHTRGYYVPVCLLPPDQARLGKLLCVFSESFTAERPCLRSTKRHMEGGRSLRHLRHGGPPPRTEIRSFTGQLMECFCCCLHQPSTPAARRENDVIYLAHMLFCLPSTPLSLLHSELARPPNPMPRAPS